MRIETGKIDWLTKYHHGYVVGPELTKHALLKTDGLALQYWGIYNWATPRLPEIEFAGTVRALFVEKGRLEVGIENGLFTINEGTYLVVGPRGKPRIHSTCDNARGYIARWPAEETSSMYAVQTGVTAHLEQTFSQWTIGHFLGQKNAYNPLLTTTACELKRWRHNGPINYPPAIFGGECEFITVEQGMIAIIFCSRDMSAPMTKIIGRGEYCAIGSNIEKIVHVVEAPTCGLTLRWPSYRNIQTHTAS